MFVDVCFKTFEPHHCLETAAAVVISQLELYRAREMLKFFQQAKELQCACCIDFVTSCCHLNLALSFDKDAFVTTFVEVIGHLCFQVFCCLSQLLS